MVGHWNRDIGQAYIGDLEHGPPAPVQEQEEGEAQASDTVPSRVARLSARPKFRYEVNRLRRYQCSNGPAGTCQSCGWHTDWEEDAAEQPRVTCFFCRQLVCRRWCVVPDYLVCKKCYEAQGNSPDQKTGLAFPPAKVRRVDAADSCYSCGRQAGQAATQPGGPASSRAALPGAVLLRCHRCNRWLCRTCRQEQAPPACVVCPALHQPGDISLRQVHHRIPDKELDRLWEMADKTTLARGRGRLSTGEYTHQSDIHGRAERVARGMGKRARPVDE